MAALSRSSNPCILGSGTRIRGTLSGEEDVIVEGKLEGSVSLRAEITVAQDAHVQADMQVERAVIAGQVVGDIVAEQSVILDDGARVEGKLRATSLEVAQGAQVFGRIEMDVELPEELARTGRN